MLDGQLLACHGVQCDCPRGLRQPGTSGSQACYETGENVL
jgi:hypothetical protein